MKIRKSQYNCTLNRQGLRRFEYHRCYGLQLIRTKDGQKYGYDTEAFAIYDTIQYVSPPVHTIAVGTAWGEAAMLLAAGSRVRLNLFVLSL